MITPDKLQEMISYRAPTLTKLARDGVYQGPAFSSCKFLGITKGGQICYQAVFLVKGGTDSTKVFLTHTPGRVIVDCHLTELA